MALYIWRAVKALYRRSAASNAPEMDSASSPQAAQAKIYSVFDVLPFLSIRFDPFGKLRASRLTIKS
jgi:hypothetical protein